MLVMLYTVLLCYCTASTVQSLDRATSLLKNKTKTLTKSLCANLIFQDNRVCLIVALIC